MKSLVVVLCLAAIVSSGQADALNCRRFGYCSTSSRVRGGAVSGSYVYVVDDTFGLRITDAGELQSPAEGRNVDAQNTAWPGYVHRAGDYVAEAGGALVGGVLGSAGAGLVLGLVGAALFYSPGSAYPLISPSAWGFAGGAAIGIVLGYPAGCAWGTTTVGSWLNCEGNIGGAYAGAYIGLLLPPIGSPIGAVIGYNLGAEGGYASSIGTRVSPPAVALSVRSDRNRQRSLGFDCRLVTVRF